MLLPIVLLLASAAPAQQATDVAAATQRSSTEQNRGAISNPGPNSFFVHPEPNARKPQIDEGIIHPKHPCVADGTCKTGCLSITAYVFSDGENPELQYVTHCPNLDVPYQTKRAHHDETDTEQQPALKTTSF